MKVWINSALIDSTVGDVDSDGWPAGEGVFETIRTENGKVFELGRHMRRAGTAAAHFGFNLPDEESIRVAIESLLIAEPRNVGRLRLLFSSERFVAVHQKYVSLTEPARLMIADADFTFAPISFKTFPYDHRLVILKKAKGLGFDEVILIGENGQVSEGAVSNYIFQINGDWVTTPLTAGVIPGVQRGIVIERCGVLVKSLTPADLLIAKRAMVISSLKIALPVASIGDYKLIVDEESSSMQEKIRTNTKAHSVG